MTDVYFRTDELRTRKYLSVRDGWPAATCGVGTEKSVENGSLVQERQACNMQAEDKTGDVRIT